MTSNCTVYYSACHCWYYYTNQCNGSRCRAEVVGVVNGATGTRPRCQKKYLCSIVHFVSLLFASISIMSSCASLLCVFSLSRICSRQWRLLTLGCGLLWCLLSPAYGLSCVWPCNPSQQCTHIDTSNCRYGLVKDVCGCCNVCGKGLGELCGGIDDIEGKCGPGFECITMEYEGLSEAELEQIPGFCQQVITGKNSLCCRSINLPAWYKIECLCACCLCYH